ncbi:MAG: energy transducer TonB [Rectinemataceae bacterium]
MPSLALPPGRGSPAAREPARTPSRRGVAIALALALHAAAIVLFLSLDRAPQAIPAYRTLSLVDLDLPPPPPAAPKHRSAPGPSEPTAPTVPSARARPSVPTSPSSPAARETNAGPSTAKAAPSETSAGPEEPEYFPQYEITEVPVIPTAEILSRIEYPPIAARQGIEATVYLELYIDKDGVIRRIVVLKDPGYGFAGAAVKALEGVVTRPARVNGQPAAVRFRYPIRFVLK